MEHIVIGIEGLVGAGKTSICKQLLKEIPDSIVLHGGNLYRAIVYAIVKAGIQPKELATKLKGVDVKQLMDFFKVEIRLEEHETQFYVDGKHVTEEELQTKESSLAVSVAGNVADNKNLFLFGKELIDQFKKQYHVIFSRKGHHADLSRSRLSFPNYCFT